MISHIHSACPVGVEAKPVKVEVDVREHNLRINIVGLPDQANRESKDRLIPAITNSGFALGNDEIVINLSPNDMRKEGMSYDLAMAIGILAAKGVVPKERLKDFLVIGELALDGSVLPVRSVLASAECAQKKGLPSIIVPRGNGAEAALISGLKVYEVDSLASMAWFLKGKNDLAPYLRCPQSNIRAESLPDLIDVKGHSNVKRALEIAAAGNHNILLYGPPGSGKSMLGKRLPGIMPPMSEREIIEVSRIYSCVGKLGGSVNAILTRPFRSPHHTASQVALIGGGAHPRPGEVTQAHRGVLFLDEFPEFPRTVLEVLRQPLEDHEVTVSRVAGQMTFPANFLLVAAMNPCPCGWLGDRKRSCFCTPAQVRKYRSRISGPLMDRIDLHIETPSIAMSRLRRLPPTESSATVQTRVIAAREIQSRRFADDSVTNGDLPSKDLDLYCGLSDSLADFLDRKIEALGYSIRVHDKVLRVSRTIADLAGADTIEKGHLLEAMGYRQLDMISQVPELVFPMEVPA